MITDFQTFNLVGLVKVSSSKAFASGMMILSDGHSVEKTASVDAEFDDSLDKEPAVILFTAIIKEKKSTVFTNNLSSKFGGVDLSKNETIGKLIHGLIKQYQLSL